MTTAKSYTEAKESGALYYFTGRPCKRGHVDKRYAPNGTCVSCMKEDYKSRSKTEEFKKGARIRNTRYVERLRESDPEGYRNRVNQNARRYIQRNRELIRQRAKTPEARARDLAHVVKRQKRTKVATPVWADMEQIKRVYLMSALAGRVYGVPHHVDHIIPIAGANVCGLHVESNLRVVPYWENIEKGNKLI